MAKLDLNMQQENELGRLLDFEREHCFPGSPRGRRCAFPYRHDNLLQTELIALGILVVNRNPTDSAARPVVAITSNGYSYFAEKAQAERQRRARDRHDFMLVLMSGALALLCTIIGFLVGTITAP